MAVSQASMKLTKIVERFELEILNAGKNYERCLIREDDINRPALQILGFFDYFNPRYSSSTEMSAGLTPLMREACPTVAGRNFASFCAASMRSPRMDV